jgi:hypothetical protein
VARRAESASGQAKVAAGFKLDPPRLALVDEAAKRRGWSRQAWLERLVDRGLQGEGLLERDEGRQDLPAKVTPPPDRPPAGKPGTRGGAREVEPRFGGKVRGS